MSSNDHGTPRSPPGADAQHQCKDCDKTFRRVHHLKRHRASVHAASLPFQCAFCGRCFNREDSLQRHGLVHTVRRRNRTRIHDTDSTSQTNHPAQSSVAISPASSTSHVRQTHATDPSTLASPHNRDRYTKQYNWLPVLSPWYAVLPVEAPVEHLEDRTVPTEPERAANGLSAPDAAIAVGESPSAQSNRELYIHGHGARDSQQQSQTVRTSVEHCLLGVASSTSSSSTRPSFQFPASITFPDRGDTVTTHVWIDSAYATLQDVANRLIFDDSGIFFAPFARKDFPSRAFIGECILTYLEYSDRDFPIIHPSTWQEDEVHWILVLATCTVGASLSLEHDGREAAIPCREWLRRALLFALEDGRTSGVPLYQAATLYFLSLQISASTEPAVIQHAYAAISTAENKVAAQDGMLAADTQSWSSWIERETIIRLRYLSWRLVIWADLMGYSIARYDARSIVLPCADVLWRAQNQAYWNSLLIDAPTSITMEQALQSLYIHRALLVALDLAGMIATVYGVIDRTLQVERQLRHHLGGWTPVQCSDRQTQARRSVEQVEWLPANSTYAGWRNSACDSLDLLHWRAQIDIAAHAGREGPVVLHLHLARLVLLTPFRDMISFASYAATSYRAGHPHISLDTSPTSPAPDPLSDSCTALWRWLTLDSHKGRLAVVHAGATIWHIRRFAQRNICEPFAVFMATLILWLYALYQPRLKHVLENNQLALSRLMSTTAGSTTHSNAYGPETSADISEHGVEPTTVLVDRPCDDEIVQLFVRKGHLMEPCILDSVPICSGDAFKRVLEEGIRLLYHCRHSGFAQAQYYQQILLGLSYEPT